MSKISREKFIRLGTALGVGAATASVAACGGASSGGSGSSGGGSGSGSGGSGSAGSSSGAASSQGSGGSAIAQESEVNPGSAVTFQDGGEDAVLVHLENGEFVAYSAVCTHAGCTVAYQDGQLACPCHGSEFDPANGGEPTAGPAQEPLPKIQVEVQNGQIVRA